MLILHVFLCIFHVNTNRIYDMLKYLNIICTRKSCQGVLAYFASC
jgi:hypothetical protein